MKGRFATHVWKFSRNALAFVATLVVVVLILPSKARSQLGLDPCCAIISAGLQSMSCLLKDVLAKPPAFISHREKQSADFERQVVWPVTAINQARGLAVQAQGQFTQMRQLFQVPVSSATLPTPQQLEQSLLSRNPGAVAEIRNNYSSLYGPT